MANTKNPFEALFKQMSAEIIKATKSHYFATVTSVTTGGIGLSIDGDTSGVKKFTCNRGEKFASGDRVLVAKESGTYVVICKIGSPGGPVSKTSDMTQSVGVDSSGALWTKPSSYTLPTASSTTLGGVKPTAKTTAMTQSVGVDSSGALWTTPGGYTLPTASSTTLGGVKPASKTSLMTQSVGVDSSGALWTAPGGSSYTLPTASSTTLGGVKPTAKTSVMTQSVGVDSSGALWTAPGGSGSGKVTTLYSSTSATSPYTLTLNTSGTLVPNTYSQYGIRMGLGSSTYWMGECYLGGYSALHLGNNSTSATLGFFGVTPQARQTLSTVSTNMGYTSVNSANYLVVLNNLVGILANKHGLIKT